MGKIFGKMPYQVTKRLPGLRIFLSTIGAIAVCHFLTTILAGLIGSQVMFTHIFRAME